MRLRVWLHRLWRLRRIRPSHYQLRRYLTAHIAARLALRLRRTYFAPLRAATHLRAQHIVAEQVR